MNKIENLKSVKKRFEFLGFTFFYLSHSILTPPPFCKGRGVRGESGKKSEMSFSLIEILEIKNTKLKMTTYLKLKMSGNLFIYQPSSHKQKSQRSTF